ncbi:MAG: twin-arginine translocase TatA/TatE family subunit [Zetaproteobacteria bacterium]|nr:twin-arginine translocase TatA/TatE family subunit [Zetaproteobacteria bacterium]
MFGIGFPELLVIAILIILVVGPEQLPQVMRKSVSFIKEAKRHFSEIQTAVNDQLEPMKKPLSTFESTIQQELQHPDQKMAEDRQQLPTDLQVETGGSSSASPHGNSGRMPS